MVELFHGLFLFMEVFISLFLGNWVVKFFGFIWQQNCSLIHILFQYQLCIVRWIIIKRKTNLPIYFSDEIRLGRNHAGTNSVDITMCSYICIYRVCQKLLIRSEIDRIRQSRRGKIQIRIQPDRTTTTNWFSVEN